MKGRDMRSNVSRTVTDEGALQKIADELTRTKFC